MSEEQKTEPEHSGYVKVEYERKKHHWVIGSCCGYKYRAKVYDSGFDYNIGGGRIHKFFVCWQEKDGDNLKEIEVLNYDIGWNVMPTKDVDIIVCWYIRLTLEKLPPKKLNDGWVLANLFKVVENKPNTTEEK